MPHQKKSFSEVAFVEAVARQVSLTLVIRPVRPGAPTRMCSRFLAADSQGNPILAAPWTPKDDRKVFVPGGWDLGMTFPMGGFTLQARSRVLGHCQHRRFPTKRVDALLVERSTRVVSLSSRRHPRTEIDPERRIVASLWPEAPLAQGAAPAPRTGMLANRSQEGLGIRLDAPPNVAVGQEAVCRLIEPGAVSARIYQGVLKHVTAESGGKWLVGLGDVVELGPGQAVPIMESLVHTRM